jgi:hypothetical protein
MCVEYQCESCHRVHSVNDGPVAYYTLPDGRSFFGPHGIGWCFRCGRLTEVEEIGAPEVLEQRLDMLRLLPDFQASEGLEEHFRKLVTWARIRRVPPRCLRCGNRDFAPLERGEEFLLNDGEDDPVEFRHPACGGRFRVKEVLFSQPISRCLSADGELLEGRWDGEFYRWGRRLWG